MNKPLALLISVALLTSPLSTNAFGATKAGATCTKAGATSTVSNIKYTCIKSGKKLVWDKGVSVPSSKPSPSTNNAARKVIVDPIRVAAFNQVHSKSCADSYPNLTVSTSIGPSFNQATSKAISDALISDFKCFGDLFTAPTKLQIFYVTELDESFVKDKVIPVIIKDDVPHMDQIMLDMKNKKWGNVGSAGGFVNKTYTPNEFTMVIHVTSNYTWKSTDSKLPMHEFTHVIQHFYRDKMQTNTEAAWFDNFPGWFAEGGADTLAFSVVATSPENLDSMTRINGKDMANDTSSPQYRTAATANEMITLIKTLIAPNSDAARNYQYPIGQLVSEYILGTYGFDSYLTLIKNSGTFSSFSENLKATIGLSQEEFLVKAAPYVLAQWQADLKS